MKLLIISICFFYCAIPANAQDVNDYSYVDRIALNIPLSQTNSTTDIAAYIKNNFNTESKKVRAAYTWVTTNIKYSTDSIHRVILNEDRDQKVTYALRRKKGVCENFAAIFNDICVKSGINSYVIEGYTKQNGSIDRTSHVWCSALVNNKWYLYDPTWDAGFSSNGGFLSNIATKYFQILPEEFIQTHIPYDPIFQFLNYPVTYKEFSNGNTEVNSRKSYFNFIDSISVYEKMDSLKRYLSALSRIERNGAPPSKSGIKMKQIKLEVELIYQDKDMDNYNSAIADYNDAIVIFNNFINYRNTQFQPAKKDAEIEEGFNEITKLVSSANLKLSEVSSSKATLMLDTGDIKKKLDDLTLHVKEQKNFLKNYLSSVK